MTNDQEIQELKREIKKLRSDAESNRKKVAFLMGFLNDQEGPYKGKISVKEWTLVRWRWGERGEFREGVSCPDCKEQKRQEAADGEGESEVDGRWMVLTLPVPEGSGPVP